MNIKLQFKSDMKTDLSLIMKIETGQVSSFSKIIVNLYGP